MRNVGLDALVKSSRFVNSPPPGARERGRLRLAEQIARDAVAASVALKARAPLAEAPKAPANGNLGASVRRSASRALWPTVFVVGAATGLDATWDAPLAPEASFRLAPSPVAVVSTQPSAEAASGSALAQNGAPALAAPTKPAAVRALPRKRQGLPAGSIGAAPEAPSGLERELEALRSARRALEADSPQSALALLDQYAAAFPRGVLRPESEVLRILALCAAGQVASAKRARDRFAFEQPGSPLETGLRGTCVGVR